MSQLDITLRQDKTDYAPHERVEGALRWSLESSAHRIEVSLLWYTSGRGKRNVGVIDTLKIDHPSAVGSRDFAFTLPEGPYSFTGKLITMTWALEATSLPGKQTVRQEIIVSPTRRRIVLNREIRP